MDLTNIINDYINEHNISVREFSRRTGLSNSYISRIVNGQDNNPSLEAIKKIAKALNISSIQLFDMLDDNTSIHIKGISNIHPIDKQRVPMLGEVACGKPIQCIEDRESYVLAGTEIDCDFCLTCRGDSMINARIHDGDIVFVKKMDMVENGDIAVVVIEDEATLKRFFYYPQKGLLVLKPENPKYEDLMYAKDELNQIHVLGKAIAFQSDVE